jgi:hypothetical protein
MGHGNRGKTTVTTRYLWTLERQGRTPRSGFDTVDDLTAILKEEDLPGVMPADWIVATLQIDEDDAGSAVHVSPLGWTLRFKGSRAV